MRSPLRQTYSSVWLNELGQRGRGHAHYQGQAFETMDHDRREQTVLRRRAADPAASIKPPTPPSCGRGGGLEIQDKHPDSFEPWRNHPSTFPRHAHEKICRTMGPCAASPERGKTFPEYMTLEAVEQQQYAAAAAEIEFTHEELRILEGQ